MGTPTLLGSKGSHQCSPEPLAGSKRSCLNQKHLVLWILGGQLFPGKGYLMQLSPRVPGGATVPICWHSMGTVVQQEQWMVFELMAASTTGFHKKKHAFYRSSLPWLHPSQSTRAAVTLVSHCQTGTGLVLSCPSPKHPSLQTLPANTPLRPPGAELEAAGLSPL